MNTKLFAAVASFAIVAAAFAQTVQPVDEKDVPKAVIDQANAQRQAKLKAMEEAAKAAAAEASKPRPVPVITSTDADVAAIVSQLVGTFTSDAQGADQPALMLASAVVNVEGLDNAVYFELTRVDSPAAPFRQGIFHVWKKKGQPILRQYSFLGQQADFGRAMAGMWMVPEVFPVLKAERLVPAVDVALTNSNGSSRWSWTGTATAPTGIGNAKEFSGTWSLSADTLAFADRGLSSDGQVVWGPADGQPARSFKRATITTHVERRNGVFVYDLIVPSSQIGDKLATGYEAYAHTTGFTTEGVEFWTSKQPGQDGTIQPFRIALPGQMIPGFNTGVEGISNGVVRRIYIPTGLAYGNKPPRTSKIPPNADLIFNLETVYVAKSPEQPAPPAPPAPSTTPVPVKTAPVPTGVK